MAGRATARGRSAGGSSMSSLPVAVPQRRASPRLPLGLVALVVALAIGTGLFVGAMAISKSAAPAQSTAVTVLQPHPAVPAGAATAPKHRPAMPPASAASASQMANYKQLVADLVTAR